MWSKLKNSELKDALIYWENNNIFYKKLFSKEPFNTLVVLADLVYNNNEIDTDIIKDFVDGLASCGVSLIEKKTEKNDEISRKINDLVEPTIREIMKVMKSDGFQDLVWDQDFERIKNLHKNLREPGHVALPNRRPEEIIYSLFSDLKNLNVDTSLLSLGFDSKLPESVINEVYVYMIKNDFIKSGLSDFMAVFNYKSGSVSKPIIWNIQHNRQPNKTALFTFIKLMLHKEKMSRRILAQANLLFNYKDDHIFPSKYTFPRSTEQQSSIVMYFKPVKLAIKNTRP